MLFKMFHYSPECVLRSIVFEEELVAILAHLLYVGSQHTVNCLYKCFNGIAWTVEAVTVLLC